MVVANGDDQRPPDPSLLKLRLVQNPALTVRDVARAEGVSSAYVYCLLRPPWLAPDIAAAIVNGRNPPQLTAKKLMRLTGRLPVDRAGQRQLLGSWPIGLRWTRRRRTMFPLRSLFVTPIDVRLGPNNSTTKSPPERFSPPPARTPRRKPSLRQPALYATAPKPPIFAAKNDPVKKIMIY